MISRCSMTFNLKMKAVFFSLFITFGMIACSGSSSSGAEDKDEGDSVTITHLQLYDFSEDILGVRSENPDGDIYAAYNSGTEKYLFWLANGAIIADLGKVSFSSVTEEPEDFEGVNNIEAFLGHVYYLKLADGTALIKITKMEPHDTESGAITFIYKYTEEDSF